MRNEGYLSINTANEKVKYTQNSGKSGSPEAYDPHQSQPNPYYYEEVYNRSYNYHNLDKAIQRQQNLMVENSNSSYDVKGNTYGNLISTTKNDANKVKRYTDISKEPSSSFSLQSSPTSCCPSFSTSSSPIMSTSKASAVTVMSSSYVNNYHFDTNYSFNRYMNLYQASWDMILNNDDNTEMTNDMTMDDDEDFNSSFDSFREKDYIKFEDSHDGNEDITDHDDRKKMTEDLTGISTKDKVGRNRRDRKSVV